MTVRIVWSTEYGVQYWSTVLSTRTLCLPVATVVQCECQCWLPRLPCRPASPLTRQPSAYHKLSSLPLILTTSLDLEGGVHVPCHVLVCSLPFSLPSDRSWPWEYGEIPMPTLSSQFLHVRRPLCSSAVAPFDALGRDLFFILRLVLLLLCIYSPVRTGLFETNKRISVCLPWVFGLHPAHCGIHRRLTRGQMKKLFLSLPCLVQLKERKKTKIKWGPRKIEPKASRLHFVLTLGK